MNLLTGEQPDKWTEKQTQTDRCTRMHGKHNIMAN